MKKVKSGSEFSFRFSVKVTEKTTVDDIIREATDIIKARFAEIIVQPEESEDERIRKEIIDFIQWAEDRGMTRHDYHQAKRPAVWIAYLEKQKDAFENGRQLGIMQEQARQELEWDGQKEQKPAEWSEEDDEMLDMVLTIVSCSTVVPYSGGKLHPSESYKKDISNWLKSLRPHLHNEIYQAAKHDLAIKFMNYLDENRPEGKMSLSNAECEDIDKAFKESDWAKIMRYIEKYGK